ncbi:hypothetical protein FPOAC2_12877 [Fusarium poae]|uniref:hypothetical protein n=1 Tax=Fusarium poae TaxID=36050 RepID=UPI001CEBB86C|nr:hypothetical protein FPOAC1_012530 [Fusarium poae]KAG8667695.1 hypothetical protein FPOAC1_012530 [Fusarium poae]
MFGKKTDKKKAQKPVTKQTAKKNQVTKPQATKPKPNTGSSKPALKPPVRPRQPINMSINIGDLHVHQPQQIRRAASCSFADQLSIWGQPSSGSSVHLKYGDRFEYLYTPNTNSSSLALMPPTFHAAQLPSSTCCCGSNSNRQALSGTSNSVFEHLLTSNGPHQHSSGLGPDALMWLAKGGFKV